MDAPQDANYNAPDRISGFEMQQFMEQDLVVDFVIGQSQNGSEHTADECGGKSGNDGYSADFYLVCQGNGLNPFHRFRISSLSMAKHQPQPDIRQKIFRQMERDPGEIDQVQPIKNIGGSSQLGNREGKLYPGEGIFPGEQGSEGFHPQGPVEQHISSNHACGNQQDDAQDPPDGELPPGREFIPKERLDGQQQHSHTGSRQGLKKK